MPNPRATERPAIGISDALREVAFLLSVALSIEPTAVSRVIECQILTRAADRRPQLENRIHTGAVERSSRRRARTHADGRSASLGNDHRKSTGSAPVGTHADGLKVKT